MTNRREFLKRSAFLAAGAMVAPQIISASSINSLGAKNIGLQLYSLRDMVREQGIQPVLEFVAKVGYVNLETAGYSDGKIYGLEPEEFKKMVEGLGMKVTSAHLGQSYSKENPAKVMDWWKQAIEAHKKGGFKYMIQPSMPVGSKSPLDDLKLYCEYFSKVGAMINKAGMKFGFHNHAGEFKKIGDHVIYDYMLEHADKDHVMFELDVYWCVVGGADPVEYLKKYKKQITVTHIKDEKEIGASGDIDFEAIFKQMNKNKMNDWYVEVERYTDNNPQKSVKESFDFLNKAKYVK